MAEELCRDVRQLILERASASEDMCFVLMEDNYGSTQPSQVMFYAYRNMRSPSHHISFTAIPPFRSYQDTPDPKVRSNYLLRTPEALERMVADSLEVFMPSNVAGIYVQGANRPLADALDWHFKNNQATNKEHRDYVLSHHYVSYGFIEEPETDEEWERLNAERAKKITQRIIALVSTN